MKILKSDRGSTSILVVIFMIVLMIFGLSILTTAISNTKLAEKKREWLTNYYKLEEEVAFELKDIDIIINDIKRDSLENYNTDSNLKRSDFFYESLLQELPMLGYDIYVSEIDTEKVLMVNFDLKEDSGVIPKHIFVELKIIIPENELSEGDFIGLTNYEIKTHKEWQEPFEYKESIKFEDPFENPNAGNDGVFEIESTEKQ